MSSIDERIVKMTFDNKQFESGVKTTLNSLDELKKGTDFSGIESGVQSLQKRFSTLGIVGMEVTKRITNAAIDAGKKMVDATLGQIKSGGMTRALNMEQARFQLEGLGLITKEGQKLANGSKASAEQAEKSWQKALDVINYGVQDTAYGLDAAAKAASMFGASGMSLEQMKTPLRAISGVAAMTGSSYENIADIFTTVAGNGRLMGDQLLQFSSRGLNAAATITDYYNKTHKGAKKTEKDIREMVTKGEIDFKTFAAAMDDAFGEHAKDANRTFTGSLANMKTALSRIGADFAQPYMKYMIPVFNTTTGAIKEVQKWFGQEKGLVADVTSGMKTLSDVVTRVINALTGYTDNKGNYVFGYVAQLASTLEMSLRTLYLVIKPIGQAFKEMFPNASIETIKTLITYFSRLSVTIYDKVAKQSDNLKDGYKGVFTIFKALGNVIKFLASAVKAVTAPFGGLIGIVGGLFGMFGRAVQRLYDFIGGSERLKTAADNIVKYLGKASQAIHDFVSSSRFLQTVNSIIHGVGAALSFFGKAIAGLFGSIKDSTIFEKIANGFTKLKESIKGLFSGGDFKLDFSSVFGGFTNLFEFITGGFSKVIDFLAHIDFGKLINTGIGVAVAAAITDIAGSIKFLADKLTHDGKNIVNATKQLPVLFKDLGYELKYSLKAKQLKAQAASILIFAGALLVLTFAARNLAKLSPEELVRSIAGVFVLFKLLDSELAKLQASLDTTTNKGLIKVAVGLLIFAMTIKSLAKSVKLLGELKVEDLAKGLIGIAVLMASLGIFVNKLNHVKLDKAFNASTGLGLMGLAIALNIMASAVRKLGGIPIKELGKGIASLAVILAAVTGMTRLAGDPKHMMSMGAGILVMSTSMLIFAKAVNMLGGIETKSLVKGLWSLATILLTLSAVVNSMSGITAVAVGASLVAMSIGVLAISAALKVLSTIAGEDLAKGVVSIIAILATLGILAFSVNPVSLIAASAAIVIFAAGITLLTPALLAFSNLSIDGILKALIMLAGVLLTLGIAATALAPVTPLMMLLGVAIAVLGAGVLVTAAGLMLLAAAFTALAAAGTAGAAVLVAACTQILEGLVTMVPTIATALAEGILTFITTIASHTAELVDAAVKLGTALLDGLARLIPKLVTTGMNLIMSLLSGIAQNIGKIAAMGGRIIVSFIQGIAAMIGPIIQAGINLMLSFILGLANGIRDNSELFFDALGSLVEAMLEMFITALEKMASHIPVVGKKISKGLKGIKEDMRDTFDVEETNKKFKKSMEDNQKAVEELAPDFKMAGQNSKNALKEGAGGLGADMGALGKDGIQSMLDSFSAGEIDLEAAGIKLDDATKKGLQNGTLKSSDVADQMMAEYNASLSKGGEKAKGKAKKIGDDSAAAFSSGNDKAKKEGEKKAQSYAAGISPKDVLKNIKSIMTAAAQAFSDRTAVAQVKTSGVKTVEMFANAIKGAKSQANNAGKTAASNAGTGFKSKDAYNTSNTAGINLGEGFVKGIKAKNQAAYDAGYKQGQKAAQGQKDGAKESSPSKIAIQTGKYLGEGLVIGIRSMNRTVYKAGYNMGDQAATSLSAAMTKVYDTLNSDMDFNPTITPVLDLSNVQNGINSMNGMLDTRRISARVSGNMSRVGLRQQLALASGPQSTTNNTNTFNITVDGAGDPIDVANEIVNQIQLVTRMS